MEDRCERRLKRIRPTPIVLRAIEEEDGMSDHPSSPEESYAVPLPPTPPPSPELSRQLSPTRSEEPVVSGHKETVVTEHANEDPAGMEVQDTPSNENSLCGSDDALPTTIDDPDAPLTCWLERVEFFKCLESAVLHCLNKVLRMYAEAKCNGCQISHPSQRQHTCLLDPPDDIYQTSFHGVMRMLWDSQFVQALEKYMESYGFYETCEGDIIGPAAEILLLGYRSGGPIYDRIYRMYDEIKPDEERIERFIKLVMDCCYTC
ncbi:uncharacterized protein LOC128321731 [Pangasianodon hypophthalmus]|uniref:uncharacterized protein LOC128321731 n=1 Tax=Pangasianodon hypophthalmus TaxID=310915 RepID=UPI00230734A4|nr:uncharacterized protein LOC128321731 [Pangasianodon hypophthalmus]